ncbi:HET-domain-containing protein [Whalleya microplaca]|nr:HET-domain-containing protein [Whalleya microplaca]
MDQYEYTPLDHETDDIRLVTILPGEFDDPIRIRITHGSLGLPFHDEKSNRRLPLKEIRKTLPEKWRAYETLEGRVLFEDRRDGRTTWIHPDPSVQRDLYDPILDERHGQSRLGYEALSYVWGSPNKQDTVIVDSATEQREYILGITYNLAEAMRHLRYNNNRSRVMWIDAICINQRDNEERNNQVKRMDQIFSLASRVVAWLGPSFPNSTLALETLDHLGRQVEFTRHRLLLPSPGAATDWYNLETTLSCSMDVWNAIGRLCMQPWFYRLWIVQEIGFANARSVLQCGRDEILWPLFRKAIECIHSKEGAPTGVKEYIGIVFLLCSDIRANPFFFILIMHTRRACEKDQDKIYGLLSLAPEELRRHIRVDYSQPPMEVFKQVFLASATHEKRLTHLQFSRQRQAASASPAWSTWIPDWAHGVTFTVPSIHGSCASGISAAGEVFNPPGRLEVTGLSFTTVSSVGEPLAGKFWSVIETVRCLGLDQLQELRYLTGETYLEAYLQTLVLGLLKARYPQLAYPTIDHLRNVVTAATASGNIAEGDLSNYYENSIARLLRGCRLLWMQNKYIGMTSGEAQEGDEVFVILGRDTPMVLRPTSSGEYEVIGDCYVHGIMDGEALLGAIDGPWRIRILFESDGCRRPWYFNVETQHESTEDPRLENIPIPSEWVPIEWERTRADPHHCKKFRNMKTGDVINSDPRLFPEALIERGIPMKRITLV